MNEDEGLEVEYEGEEDGVEVWDKRFIVVGEVVFECSMRLFNYFLYSLNYEPSVLPTQINL